MTKPGAHPLPDTALELMARLHALHLFLHPDRIGRLYGVSGEYVRRQYRNKPLPPPSPEWSALVELVSRL